MWRGEDGEGSSEVWMHVQGEVRTAVRGGHEEDSGVLWRGRVGDSVGAAGERGGGGERCGMRV